MSNFEILNGMGTRELLELVKFKMNALHLAIYFAWAFIAPYFIAGLEADVGFDMPGRAFEVRHEDDVRLSI